MKTIKCVLGEKEVESQKITIVQLIDIIHETAVFNFVTILWGRASFLF